MIRVLVTGDLPDLVEVGMEVVGRVATAGEILSAARALSPQVVALDLGLPRIAELGVIDRLLGETSAALVVLLAADVAPDPGPLVRGLAIERIEIVRRSGSAEKDSHAVVAAVHAVARARAAPGPAQVSTHDADRQVGQRVAIFGLASSTGGPHALALILSELPADLSFPVLIAQHMTPGFVSGMVTWLRRITPLEVSVAVDGEAPVAGHVYLASDGCDLDLDDRRRMRVRPSATLYSPSADKLLLSLAARFGAQAGAAVLTGMGTDGARGLLAIARAGGIAFAQDQASSVVFGMPKVAAELGAVDSFVPLDEMAAAICRCSGKAAEPILSGEKKCR